MRQFPWPNERGPLERRTDGRTDGRTDRQSEYITTAGTKATLERTTPADDDADWTKGNISRDTPD